LLLARDLSVNADATDDEVGWLGVTMLGRPRLPHWEDNDVCH
jgi:hypothetical protein